MRIEQSYPSPVHGVSTLAPRTRPRGYASRQINFRSDPVNKLTRRPSSEWRSVLSNVTDVTQVAYHSYERDGSEFSFVVDKVSGTVYCYKDDVFVNTVNLGGYRGNNLGLYTIEHETYVLNKDFIVEKRFTTDANSIQKTTHINVTSALNYAETVKVNVWDVGGTKHTVSYTVPNLGTSEPNYDAADKARATQEVARQIAARIGTGGTHRINLPNPDYDPTSKYYEIYCMKVTSERTNTNDGYKDNPNYQPYRSLCKPYLPSYRGIPSISAWALGSTVAINENSRQSWIQVEIESGQGDRTTVAINQVVESTDGLPLYAKVGTRITVRPDPTSDKGTYYLQAERVADEPNGEELEEVVWSENRNPDQPYSLNPNTMPHKIEYNGSSFTFGPVDWAERKTGDDDSVPFPEFVGKKITSMGYFQKRLVVVADNAVYMTETDKLENWFRRSAVNLLVTDPIGVTTSELGTDKILHLVPHNRDLLCITSNSQFKISGDVAITPETVSMPLTTKYECQVSVPPVTIGNSVYFPIDYGDSTGIQEYTGERDTSQDFAAPVTNHIIGYLKGKASLIAASPNLEMIAMTTTNGEHNQLFVYEQYTESGGKRSQQSWSEWKFADDETIVDMKFRSNELLLIVAKGSTLVTKAVPMYTRVTASPLEVYLDDLLVLTTSDGLTVTVPSEYSTDECVVVRGAGAKNELWKVQFTRSGDTLTLNENIGEGAKVYVGRTFTSLYEPTRPFKYDEDGSTITTDKIRVSRWILSLVDTHEVSMTKTSEFNDPVTTKFESRFVGQYALGTIGAYTGDQRFSFAEDAALARATFFTENYLGCTISDVSWEGQYFQSKTRM